MFKKTCIFFSLLMAATILSACTMAKTAQSPALQNTQTGYWYLGDDGIKQWRVINSTDVTSPAPAIPKKYPSALGHKL